MTATPSPEQFRAGEIDNCPKCNDVLVYFWEGQGPYWHTTGVEIQGKYDGVLYWAHWGCYAWQRWPESHLLYSVAQPIIEMVNGAWSNG